MSINEEILNECDEKEEEEEPNLRKKSTSGNATSKLNFDNVTVEHVCQLPGEFKDSFKATILPLFIHSSAAEDIVKQCLRDFNNAKLVSYLIRIIIIWRDNPNTKTHFQSSHLVNKEITRHILSNYWYIIHPFSCFRLWWNSLMTIVLHSLFLFIPFEYAFYQDLARRDNLLSETSWWKIVSLALNSFCYVDILLNFFTGYHKQNGNFIVLKQSLIARNYTRKLLWFDLLSSLPMDMLFRKFFSPSDFRLTSSRYQLTWIMFHILFVMRFLRFASFMRAKIYLRDLLRYARLNHVVKTSIILVIHTFMSLQFCVCFFMAASVHIFYYFFTSDQIGPFINILTNFDETAESKYFQIMNDYVVWILFNTAYNIELSAYLPGKIITVGCMLISLIYNVYMLVQILNLISISLGSRTKYYEVMNQLDAYMQKKQFPKHLQTRLKFFYARKFRRNYFEEKQILRILSEPIKREILINTDKLFVERVKLFEGISSSIVSSIAASCKKEQFLPNDLIIKAGTVGECMFFIASGSVCVTTANGQELCHLEDGDYFGEIAFVLKNRKRIVSVQAIEYCEIYILDYANLKLNVEMNETIRLKLVETANERMELTLQAEELFKKEMDQKINMAFGLEVAEEEEEEKFD